MAHVSLVPVLVCTLEGRLHINGGGVYLELKLEYGTILSCKGLQVKLSKYNTLGTIVNLSAYFVKLMIWFNGDNAPYRPRR